MFESFRNVLPWTGCVPLCFYQKIHWVIHWNIRRSANRISVHIVLGMWDLKDLQDTEMKLHSWCAFSISLTKHFKRLGGIRLGVCKMQTNPSRPWTNWSIRLLGDSLVPWWSVFGFKLHKLNFKCMHISNICCRRHRQMSMEKNSVI